MNFVGILWSNKLGKKEIRFYFFSYLVERRSYVGGNSYCYYDYCLLYLI